MMPSTVRAQAQAIEGIAVVGEAVRRVSPDNTEFLIEISAAAQTAAQAVRDHQAKAAQIAEAIAGLGVQRNDLERVSMNVVNTYMPLMLQPYGAPPQIGPSAFGPFPAGAGLQPDVQFGTYQARSLERVTVRDTARVGEILDTLAKAGAVLAGGIAYRAADETAARKAALEAAGRDARAKAEALASAAGKKVGEPMVIFEEVVAANGVYSALRAQAPLAFGPGMPAVAGELEYYARVTASFRFQ